MPESIDSTKRFVAKTFVTTVVWQGSAGLIEGVVTEALEIEEDTPLQAGVHLGSQVAGFGIAMKLSRHTDNLVDKIADARQNRKAAKAAKKAASTETE